MSATFDWWIVEYVFPDNYPAFVRNFSPSLFIYIGVLWLQEKAKLTVVARGKLFQLFERERNTPNNGNRKHLWCCGEQLLIGVNFAQNQTPRVINQIHSLPLCGICLQDKWTAHIDSIASALLLLLSWAGDWTDDQIWYEEREGFDSTDRNPWNKYVALCPKLMVDCLETEEPLKIKWHKRRFHSFPGIIVNLGRYDESHCTKSETYKKRSLGTRDFTSCDWLN